MALAGCVYISLSPVLSPCLMPVPVFLIVGPLFFGFFFGLMGADGDFGGGFWFFRCRNVEEISVAHVTFLERGGRLARL